MADSDLGKYHKDEALYRSEVQKFYDSYPDGITLPPEYAQFVQENGLRLLIRLARYKFVAKMLRSSDRVLEVGSGSGLGSIFLSQHCNSVVGIDVKKTEVEEAKKINKRVNVDFKVADIFDNDFDLKFDVVTSLDVIEHMEEADGQKLIAAKTRHLNEHGIAIVGTPSIYSYPYQSVISQASHVKCYDMPELQKLMDQFFYRTLTFSMNDEIVHTGFHKMAWYYFIIGVGIR
ncbi:class I SAM-dependent methyltransferase [Arenicellales bacterium nBUS_45]